MNTYQTIFANDLVGVNLRKRSVRGGAITLASQVSKFVFATATTVILARMLTPEDFGLIAMVLAVIAIATMFNDAGLTDATLQRDTISHEQVSTLFWITTGFGLLVSVGVVALSPAIAWFYGVPELMPITSVLSIMFFFGGLTSQHKALLRRKMQFGRLGVVEIAAVTISLSVAVIAAMSGAGYWSLVMKHVFLAAMTALGCWIAMPWRPALPKRGSGVRSMLRFGANVSGFNLATYFSRNADNVLIGRFIGVAALGFYGKAYNLLMLPVSQIRSPITSVGLPALSRLQHDPARYREYYRKLLHVLLFLTAPLGFLLGVHSNEVILLALGAQWVPVSSVFRIFAVLVLPQSAVGTFGMVMLSCGYSGRFFRLGIFTGIISVVSFIVGLPWGINGVAMSYAIANFIVLFPIACYALHGTPISVRLFFDALLLPTLSGVVVAGVSRLTFVLLNSVMSVPLALVLCLIPSAVVYLLCYLALPGGRHILVDLKTSLNTLRPNVRTAGA